MSSRVKEGWGSIGVSLSGQRARVHWCTGGLRGLPMPHDWLVFDSCDLSGLLLCQWFTVQRLNKRGLPFPIADLQTCISFEKRDAIPGSDSTLHSKFEGLM